MNVCPCCGNAVSPNRILVDLGSNIVSIGNLRAKLAPRVAEIISVLARMAPNYISSENLAAQVWGAKHAHQKAPSIRTHVREIRKVLAPLGYGVQNARGGFYRLAPLDLIVTRTPQATKLKGPPAADLTARQRHSKPHAAHL